jgi:hypothetical protein
LNTVHASKHYAAIGACDPSDFVAVNSWEGTQDCSKGIVSASR